MRSLPARLSWIVALGLVPVAVAVVGAEAPPGAARPAPTRDASASRVAQDPSPIFLPSPPPPPSTALDPLAGEPGPSTSGSVALHFDGIDIRQALELLGRREKLNLLVSPSVAGQVTVNIDGVTREEALKAILSLGNLEMRREAGLIYIYTAEEFRQLTLTKRKVATRVYRLNYTRSDEIGKMVVPFLSTEGKVASTTTSAEGIDENANFSQGLPVAGGGSSGAGGGGGGGGTTGGNSTSGGDVVIVQDYPENLVVVDEMISKLDVMPVQVLIETVIVRVDLNRTQNLGVNFGAVDQMRSIIGVSGSGPTFASTVGFSPLKVLTAGGTLTPGTAISSGTPNYGLSFGFIGGNVSGFVTALETIGKTNVLATPRVLVLNKQRAEIQLGQRLGYRTLVTNLTSTVQQVQFLNTGTLLRLRPFISDDGMIRMEIHPERSVGVIDANGVPQTNTARMTTNVLVPNGATLVIGGLIENQDDVNQSGVPGLGRLPGVGALFRNRAQDVVKSEVVVLLTPRIWNPTDPEGLNCAPTPKTALDTATRVSQKIELGADRPPIDGILGGRIYYDTPGRADRLQAKDPGKKPFEHQVRSGENFWTISKTYYKSGRYYLALWGANRDKIPAPENLKVGDRIIVPRADLLDPNLVQPLPDPAPSPYLFPPDVIVPIIPPPPPETPGPFGENRKSKDPAAKIAGHVAPR